MKRPLTAAALAILCFAGAIVAVAARPGPHHAIHVEAAVAQADQQLPTHVGWRDLNEPATTTTTTIPPTTTTAPTTVPPSPPTTRRQRTVVVQIPTQPAPPPTGGSGAYNAPPGCMFNGEHSIAQAHACWDDLIARYPWSRSTMFSVMMCESHGNPDDTGVQTRYGRAIGLMQDMDGPYDPAQNMAVAFEKYKASGLGPWSSSASCWRSARNG